MKRVACIIFLFCNFCLYANPIKVGILEYAPPFSSKADGNHYFGFIIDLMNEVCRRMDRECVYVPVALGDKMIALQRGIIDISFDPSPITTNIPEQFMFSLPFLASHGQFVARKDSTINSYNDIKQKKIGVLKYTLFESFLSIKFDDDNVVIPYDKLFDLISAFSDSKIDLIMLNYSFAHYLMNTTPGKFKLIGDKINMGDGYGVLALKINANLINDFNHIILDMEEDGTYLKIYNQYFSY